MINASVKNGWLVLDEYLIKGSEIINISFRESHNLIAVQIYLNSYNDKASIVNVVYENNPEKIIAIKKQTKEDFEYLKKLIVDNYIA